MQLSGILLWWLEHYKHLTWCHSALKMSDKVATNSNLPGKSLLYHYNHYFMIFLDTLLATTMLYVNKVQSQTCIIGVFLYLKLPSLFAARLFWTFHNKLHNMKTLIILSHHDNNFSHLFVFMKKYPFVSHIFCWSCWFQLNWQFQEHSIVMRNF